MRKKAGKLLIRMALVVVIVFLAFFGIIEIARYFRNTPVTKALKKEKTFGINLPSRYKVHGIDVSRHQEMIDWARVDSMKDKGKEISFVFIKATEGITRQDQTFERNWKALKKRGLLRGTYHFYYPSRDAGKQAANYIRHVKLEKGDLPPVVDIEHTNGKNRKQIIKGLSVFISLLESHYKVKPIIYTNHSYYSDYLSGSFDDYPLWISYYVEETIFRKACNYDWTFWQHSEKGRVDGIRGNVDFNVFNGTEQELRELCIR